MEEKFSFPFKWAGTIDFPTGYEQSMMKSLNHSNYSRKIFASFLLLRLKAFIGRCCIEQNVLWHMNIYVHIYFIKLNIDKYYILINVYYV